jgi:hypothetical protein
LGILPVKMGYQHPKIGSDPEIGSRLAQKQVRPGVGRCALKARKMLDK